MIRIGIFSVDFVMDRVSAGWEEEILTSLNNHPPIRVKFHTKNLLLYALKGTKCIRCGAKGIYFALERNPKDRSDFRFKLYAIQDRIEREMTKDHIIPASQGGGDGLDNLQPMCYKCNHRRGSRPVNPNWYRSDDAPKGVFINRPLLKLKNEHTN